MTDKQITSFMIGLLRNSDNINIDVSRKTLGISMKILDVTNKRSLGSAFLYNTGKLRKYIPATLVTYPVKRLMKK